MELEFATVEDFAHELLTRELRFALVAIEDTNAQRTDAACFVGQGVDHQDVANLLETGCQMFDLDRV